MFSLVLDTERDSVSQLKNNQHLIGTVWETKKVGAKAHAVKITIRVTVKSGIRHVYAKISWIAEEPANCPDTLVLLSPLPPRKSDTWYR